MKAVKMTNIKHIDIIIYMPTKDNWLFSILPSIMFDNAEERASTRTILINFLCFVITFEW